MKTLYKGDAGASVPDPKDGENVVYSHWSRGCFISTQHQRKSPKCWWSISSPDKRTRNEEIHGPMEKSNQNTKNSYLIYSYLWKSPHTYLFCFLLALAEDFLVSMTGSNTAVLVGLLPICFQCVSAKV